MAMMTSKHDTFPLRQGVVELADGRALTWQDSGPPDAPAVLWLHGSTGSRRTAPRVNGIRVIAYDRPGYGYSTAHPTRTLHSDADDVRALLDALGIAHVAVLAFSGGSAVGYACAARIPDRISRLGLVSGSPWPTVPAPTDNLLRSAAALLAADPSAAVTDLIGSAPLDDRVLSDPPLLDRLVHGAGDAVAAGVEGWVTEARLTRSAWPFRPHQVRRPVLLWHGLHDDAVPLASILPWLEQLPDAHLERIPNAGQLGWIAQEDKILGTLAAA
jgi:pimeloyl-ACP methyl ester carboxylesterase